MLQYPAEGLSSLTLPSLACSPEERTLLLDQMKKQEVCENFEIRFRTREGTSCWVNLS